MLSFIRFLYNIFLPVGFILFLPGLLWKLWRRPGWKSTFAERFGYFSATRRVELGAYQGCTWFHAVSVGESVIAMNLIRALLQVAPATKVVLSTGTTTAQELARRQAPAGVAVIFAPLDFSLAVRRTLKLLQPARLVIFETEIWPNLIVLSKRAHARLFLVNARLSDHSSRGYMKAKFFFAPLLAQFDWIIAQSDGDAARFRALAPNARVFTGGNLKFDQPLPAFDADFDPAAYFGSGEHRIIMGASTHPGEEALLIQCFIRIQQDFPDARLLLVPRHAERGGEVAELLRRHRIAFARRSQESATAAPQAALLADTTGEMLKLMQCADIVVMGKSLAGHDEGHNLIEPALLAKPIVTGAVLKNFRFLLKVLKENHAVRTVAHDDELAPLLMELLQNAALRRELGEHAVRAIAVHAGATEKTLNKLEEL